MSDSTITFFVENIEFSIDFEDKISHWLTQIASSENKSIENIEYIFCSDDYLLEINKAHLNHDYYTDIITFPLSKDPIEATIFISIDRIKDNAKQFNQNVIDELHRVIAHGLLHLIGYNDKTQPEATKMREMENQVLLQRTFI